MRGWFDLGPDTSVRVCSMGVLSDGERFWKPTHVQRKLKGLFACPGGDICWHGWDVRSFGAGPQTLYIISSGMRRKLCFVRRRVAEWGGLPIFFLPEAPGRPPDVFYLSSSCSTGRVTHHMHVHVIEVV